MKKIFLIMLTVLGLSYVSLAQTKNDPVPYIQAGVGVSSGDFTKELEVGAISGRNQFSAVVETFNTNNRSFFLEKTHWYAGVKYSRNFCSGLQASGAVKIHLNEDTYNLVFEPGVAYNLGLTPSILLQPKVTTKIYEGAELFSPVRLGAGVGLQVRL